MWKHLERLGGGIGTRGPGETEIETDRRIVRDKITLLTEKTQRKLTNRLLPSERKGVNLSGWRWWDIPMLANPPS